MKALSAAFILLSMLGLASPGYAQLDLFSREQRVEFTPDWQGDRFPDGRPNVPDSVLARLKDVTADEAWDLLQDAHFRNQFEGGWTVVNPGQRLVGRVVTAVFMPSRPDVDSVIRANGKKENRIGDENSWIIDILKPGDVLVVDLFGKIRYGTIIGDNLAHRDLFEEPQRPHREWRDPRRNRDPANAGLSGLHARRRSLCSGACHAHGNQRPHSDRRRDRDAGRHCNRRSRGE